ncbi:hypothetical protein TrVGV298_006149 [Trichoderma virens]|nr:hypothetical protein TrVGV298_006149 [Trichoderma virens]
MDSPAVLPVDNPSKSYWLSEPSKKLQGYRTTEDLPQVADVLIIGSGITGALAAHFIKGKASNLNVVMLEAREVCWGATGRNGGDCQPGYYASPPHIAKFEHRNYSYLKELVESHSIPCDWRTTTGVHGYYSPELFAATKKIIEKIQQENPDIGANIIVVTKEDGEPPLCEREGEREKFTLKALRVGAAEGAVVQQNAASFWPYKLVAFVLERLVADGGFNLHTKTAVTGLKRVDLPAKLSSSHPNDDKAASGGWTFADIIVPVKGQVSSLKPLPAKGPLDIGHTFYFVSDLDDRRDDYLVQRPPPGAELIYGGGRIRAEGHGLGVWDDSTIDEGVAQYLKGGAERLDGSLDTRARKCIMGFSRDGWPWVGPVPDSAGGGDGLWLCAGYSGGGMPNAALCAKAVVDMMIPGHKDGGEVVDMVDLPREYLLTEDRLERARARETVAEADKRGALI